MGDAPQLAVLAAGIVLYAFVLATPIALVPVILLDMAGSRSLGPLFGLLFFVQTAGRRHRSGSRRQNLRRYRRVSSSTAARIATWP
jgi:hypothetical protein